MNCIDAQAMFPSFIKDKLNIEQLEAFLQHVHTCPSCMEELEIDYAVLMAVQQLDTDQELSNDYRADLQQKLLDCAWKIRRARFTKVRRRVMLFAAILCVGLFLGIQITEKAVISPRRTYELTRTCSFQLREGFFTQERDQIEQLFLDKNEELLSYVYKLHRSDSSRREKSEWDLTE